MRIGVTGADGFVGRHTVDAVRAAGHEALPLVRHLKPWSDPAASAVAEIGPNTDWQAAIAGCDVLIHLAAAVHESGPKTADRAARMRQVNVLGTERLAREAAGCGVRRMVFVSSIKVMGEASSHPFNESDPPCPIGDYATSKRDAEAALWNATSTTALQGVVVRPPLVYGPGVGANFRSLLAVCNTTLPLPLAEARALRSLLYVRNLADALVLAASHSAAAGQTFFVTDDSDVSVADLVRRLRTQFNRPRRLFAFPQRLLRFASQLAGREGAYRRLFEPLQASPAHLRSRLAWTPAFTLDEGLAITARWYVEDRSRQHR
jgi:nucleoside-diphosphate-sugar epimerase